MRFNLIKSNLIYAVGSVANSAALLLLVPFLIRTLSKEEYGAWSILEVTITLLTTFMNAGLSVGLMRHYWFTDSRKEQAQLFSTVLVTNTVWGATLSILVVAIQFFGIIPGLPVDSSQLVWVLATSWLENLFNLFLTLFRIKEFAVTFVVLSIGRMLLFLGAAIWLSYANWGVPGVLIARCVSVGIALVGAIMFSTDHLVPHFSIKKLRAVARYGTPLLGADLANFILFASDRYVLQAFVGLETIAVYTFAYKIATVADITVNRPFALDWAARRFKIAADPETAPNKYAQVLIFYLMAVIGVTLVLTSVTPMLYSWFAPASYQQGITLVPLLILAYIAFGLSYPLNVGIMLKNKTPYLVFISWGAAIVCLLLNFWLIPAYGMWGAAWATLVAYSCMTLGIALTSLYLYPIRYRFDHIIYIVSVAVVGFGGLEFLGHHLSENNSYVQVIIKIAWIGVLSLVSIIGFKGVKIFRLLPRSI